MNGLGARTWAGATVAALAVALLPGQQPIPIDPAEETARVQRVLQQNRADVERLLELRVRHDLGLPTPDGEATFRSDGAVTSETMERMQRQLRDADATVGSLRDRYEQLRAAAERLRADAAAQAAHEQAARQFVDLPAPGTRMLPREPAPLTWPPAAPSGGEGPLPPSVPSGRDAPARAPVVDIGPVVSDPVQAQIQGSKDHLRVAQALFKAGQALLDRGDVLRAQGAVEAAKEFDDRARERLVRAVDELRPLLEQPEPPFVALFYLGRCRELLFRHAERHEDLSLTTSPRDYQRREQEVREPFLMISARDVQKTGERGDVEVLGAWGQAAQTAMEHFRWMNLHGGYDARSAIEALTWPGEHDQ